MASEYLKRKYKDVKPEEKRELTPAEKRKNWWYYHKWHIAIGLALTAMSAGLLLQVLGAGRRSPDYQVAYVGAHSLPEETAAALEAGFAALGEDLNGDGQVVVQLNQYPSDHGMDGEAALAAQTALMADLVSCESYFFLMEDPEDFLREGQVLRRLDGSLPEEGEPAEDACLAWDRCPALAAMELGEYRYFLLGEEVSGDSRELVSGLFIGRRGFWTEKTCAYPDGCDALWEKIVEGAAAP